MVIASKFSPWVGWNDRQHPGANNCGVYLLARFPEGAPTGAASPLDTNIVYKGEAHRQSLLRRWGQFHQAAMNGVGKHSGGRSYHAMFDPIGEELFIACFSPIDIESDRCRSFYVKYLEAKLVWDFSQKYQPDQLLNRS